VAQLRALAHPLRLRLLELFGEQPRTTMQVAALLGEPPTRLYHHVNLLERAGLLRLREQRPNRGTVEKWYEASAPLAHTVTRAELARAAVAPESLTSAVLAVLEQSRREVAAALLDRRQTELIAVRAITAGTPRQLAVLRRRVRLLLTRDLRRAAGRAPRRTRAGNAARPRQRWALTVTFAPVKTGR